MHNPQRILLVVSCLSCFAALKLLWDSSTARPTQGRIHIGADGRVAYVNAAGADVQHGQKAPVHVELGDPSCGGLDGIEDLAMILKTGVTEIYQKLPIHLITTLKCVEDHLVFSDAPQDFAGEPIRDALSLVSKEARADLEDLEQYRILHDHMRLGGDASELRGDKSWHLDKWKFLHRFRPTAPRRSQWLTPGLGQSQRQIRTRSEREQRCLSVTLRADGVMSTVGLEAGLLQGRDCYTSGLGVEHPTFDGFG